MKTLLTIALLTVSLMLRGAVNVAPNTAGILQAPTNTVTGNLTAHVLPKAGNSTNLVDGPLTESAVTNLSLTGNLSANGANFTNTPTVNGVAVLTNAGPGGFVGTVSNAVAVSGLLAVDATKTNGVAATLSMVTNALQLTGSTTTYLRSDGTQAAPVGGVAQSVSNNIAVSGLLSVDATKTNGITATEAHVTNALGHAVVYSGATAAGSLSGSYPNPGIANSGVTAAQYGDATHVAQVTFNAAGQATAASSVPITSVTYVDGTAITNVNLKSSQFSFSVSSVTNVVIGYANSTNTYAATVTIDFSSSSYQTITLTGNLTLASSTLSPGETVTMRLIASGGPWTLTFPGSWVFVGSGVPNTLASGKTAVLTCTSFGSTDSGVVAAYTVQP